MRVPRSQVRYLRGARVVEDGERPTVIAQFDGVDQALHSLLAWGALAEVLAPQALRERIAAAAAETVALYAARGGTRRTRAIGGSRPASSIPSISTGNAHHQTLTYELHEVSL